MASPSHPRGQNWQTAHGRNVDTATAAASSAASPATRPGVALTPQQRQRNDGQSPRQAQPVTPEMGIEKADGIPESWIEVSSHPSSSSVSSIGDEIVTTGLRVGNSYQARRQRINTRSHPGQTSQQRQYSTAASNQVGHTAGGSSQEEYEESDSEDDDDRVLIKSDSEDDDDDGNATALGRRPPEPFRPQPNAFTHPPAHLAHRHSASSAIPSHHPHPSFVQRSSTRLAERRSPNLMSPGYQPDHDAALRASLTTLLSCAAAARSRPRDGPEREQEKKNAERPGVAAPTSNQPVGLRMMSENELMTASPPPTTTAQSTQPSSSRPSREQPTTAGPSRRASGEKIKRSATPTSAGSRPPPRAIKKKRTAAHQSNEQTLISPTLLTWVVSAGVVVLVSVVGFGAGYVIGREVGRQEALSSLSTGTGGNTSAAFLSAGSANTCGAEALRGFGGGGGALRKFRWGVGMSSIAA